MKFEIRHKIKGWTGTLEIEETPPSYFASHRCGAQTNWEINQDETDESGKHYFEDPEIKSFDELEFLEIIK